MKKILFFVLSKFRICNKIYNYYKYLNIINNIHTNICNRLIMIENISCVMYDINAIYRDIRNYKKTCRLFYRKICSLHDKKELNSKNFKILNRKYNIIRYIINMYSSTVKKLNEKENEKKSV